MKDVKTVLTAVLLLGLCLVSGAVCLAEEEADPAEETSSSLSAAAGAVADTARPMAEAAAAEENLEDYRKTVESEAAPEISSEALSQPMMSPAQGVTVTTQAAAGAEEEAVSAGAAERNPSEWVWGEVVSVNEANKQIVIRHLDYETYEEVQMVLSCDDKSLFENASGLTQIKPGDHLTVDYNVRDGVNIVGLVVVEKKEEKEAGSYVSTSVQKSLEAAEMGGGLMKKIVVPESAAVAPLSLTPPTSSQEIAPPSLPVPPISAGAEREEPPFLDPSSPAASPGAPSQDAGNAPEAITSNPPAAGAPSIEEKSQP